MIAYVEGQVTILVGNQPQPTNTAQPGSLQPGANAGKPGAGQTWFGRLYSVEEPRIRIASLVPKNGAPAQPPPDNAAAKTNSARGAGVATIRAARQQRDLQRPYKWLGE